ncbi:MAG TPA: hypothetical protein PLQ67_09950 [Burkholderiaceae bacterium]|nr:hypothetical protein [Burkholderiaceae bacterium]
MKDKRRFKENAVGRSGVWMQGKNNIAGALCWTACGQGAVLCAGAQLDQTKVVR